MANGYFKPQPAIVHIPHAEMFSKVGESGIHLPLSSIIPAGFQHGTPIKIRILPEGVLITAQNLNELLQCLEALSLQDIANEQLWQWLHRFPGDLYLEENN